MNKKKTSKGSRDEFLKLAKTRWGRKWRIKVAAALNVHPTTVWRWMLDDREPPHAALLALRAMQVDATANGK